jgi:glycerate 2-kinase
MVAEATAELSLPGPVVVAAVGKAAARMSEGAVRALGPAIAGGLVVAPEAERVLPPLRLHVGSHPIANAASERAGRALLDLVRTAPAGHTVLALISGGASALAAVPQDPLTLADKVAVVAELAAAGAPIGELNVVRKHLSAIKGGQLGAAAAVPVVSLVASDVVGDDLSVVGSGPTVPDPSTREQALAILQKARVRVPRAVRRCLKKAPETPKQVRAGDRAVLVAGIGALVDAARQVEIAAQAGAGVEVFARDLVGDVRAVAQRLAAEARAAARDGRPVIRVGNGEPTVTLCAHPGLGGRAQHVALLVAQQIAGLPGVAVLAAGSDGIDGNTTAAGAVVDGATWAAAGADPAAALARCDAHRALDEADALLVTGRTGVNHADFYAVVYCPEGANGLQRSGRTAR